MVISTSCSRASRSTRSVSSGLAKRASATVVGQAEGGELLGRLEAFRQPGAEREERDLAALAHDAALADLERLAFRRHLDADAFAARIAQRRRPVVDRDLRSPPCARVRPRRPPPSARSPAGSRDRRRRRSRHGSDRRRRPGRRGRWRSAPAASGSRRRAPPGRRRAAGRSSRSPRTACSLRSARPAAKVTACCSAMPTSKVRSGNSLPNRSSPVPDGIAAVMATILSSFRASLIRLSANTLV